MTSRNMRCKRVWHTFQENQHGTQSHGGLVEMISIGFIHFRWLPQDIVSNASLLCAPLSKCRRHLVWVPPSGDFVKVNSGHEISNIKGTGKIQWP